MFNLALSLQNFMLSTLACSLFALCFWNTIQANFINTGNDRLVDEYSMDYVSSHVNQKIAINPINPLFSWMNSPNQNANTVTWTPVRLYEEYRFPRYLIGTVKDIPFPQVPARWYGNKTTGISFKSNLIQNISGFSFTGQITPWNISDKVPGTRNAFAIFFHQVSNYTGGPEYGIVFRVDEKNIIFYTLTNANLPNQHWEQWPNQLVSITLEGNLTQAMGLASQVLEWSINVTPEGNFIFSITDTKQWVDKSVPKF